MGHGRTRRNYMSMKARGNRRAGGHAKPLRIASRQTTSYGSIAPCVIALSQTDTIEQARWMNALAARTEGADRRSSHDVRARLISSKERHNV
jgi:hypothetical protein